MSPIAKFFLLVVAPILALLLALLGIETLPANPLGWFLVLVGAVYPAGFVIIYAIRKRRFWESPLNGAPPQEELGDHSFWFITLGMLASFYLSPLEYIYLPASLPRHAGMALSGLGLVALGTMLFVWARRALGKSYSGHVSVTTGQVLVQSGPYRFIRHPAYAGFLLMALGISLGYSSQVGLASTFVLLLPSLIYRIKVEERLLTRHFGEAYRQYAGGVKRIIPGIW